MIFELVASKLPSWLKWNYGNNSNNLTQPRKEEMSYSTAIEYFKALAKVYFNSSKVKAKKIISVAKIKAAHTPNSHPSEYFLHRHPIAYKNTPKGEGISDDST